jgi:peptidyl-prolyl cis-trans isomerase SurA
MDMMHMRKASKKTGFFLWHFSGLLALILTSTIISLEAPTARAAEVVDRIIAVVNDEIIVLQEVNTLTRSMREQIEMAGYSDGEKQRILSEMRTSIINQLVNQKLVVQAAKEIEWLEVSEAEIDASVERIKEERNITDEELLEALEKEGLTMEELRTQLKESSLASSLENYEVTSKIVITKADVTAHYNENPDKYRGKTTYHLRNIFIKAPASDSAEDKAAVQDKLAQIFAELEAGQTFASLANKYSESTYAIEGGELGNFELSDLSPNYRAALEPLSPGEYTGALDTSDGYQILFIQEIKKESDVPLESVYSEIETELYKERYTERRQAWVKGLRENAHIKIIE